MPDLHTVACYFRDGGAHEGPIGEVRNVFGKKRAKEECARLVLMHLGEVKRGREQIAAKLIKGFAGDAGAVAGGKGLGVGEARESGDETDIYEDAVDF